MKVMVIGLDSAPPALVFDEGWNDLPTLRGLARAGAWGPLRSTHPPITVPAWSAMMSGADPGQLGFYGFRNRRGATYDGYEIANASVLRTERVWERLARQGRPVTLVGVPQTYPVKPITGCVVSDFLTPSTKHPYTWPADLRDEVERVADGYVLDVDDFRTADKSALLERIHAKTEKHQRVARHLAATRPWDFFMVVEMGVDRIQHGFWGYCDPTHRKYRAGNPFERALLDYYRGLDRHVGDLISLAPRDTAVLVVSDHGARKMEGGLCINEWLLEQGYLRLHEYPTTPKRFEELAVDWDHTLAWGEGGYHGRLFLNVRGREPRGTIAPGDVERVREELIKRIAAITDPDGRNIGSHAHRPEELYPNGAAGSPPDLTVYFGDLAWRSVGSVGLRSIHTFDNDTGPDEANHDWDGIFIANATAARALGRAGRQEGLRITDVAGLIQRLFDADH
jgi:predicted AlkP superfamily phosphohydrolase/phosphomutase